MQREESKKQPLRVQENKRSWRSRLSKQNQQEDGEPFKNIEKLVQVRHDDESRFTATYNKLISIDYLCDNYFQIEIPFTFVQWREIEQLSLLTVTKTVQADAVCKEMPLSKDIVQTMCLNILPDNNTVLHGITGNFEFLEKFLSYAMPKEKDENGDQKELFNVPFIQNLDGQTPLHLAMNESPQKMLEDQSKLVQEKVQEHNERFNMRSAELLLSDLLSEMPLDHHSRVIADLIPILVKK